MQNYFLFGNTLYLNQESPTQTTNFISSKQLRVIWIVTFINAIVLKCHSVFHSVSIQQMNTRLYAPLTMKLCMLSSLYEYKYVLLSLGAHSQCIMCQHDTYFWPVSFKNIHARLPHCRIFWTGIAPSACQLFDGFSELIPFKNCKQRNE